MFSEHFFLRRIQNYILTERRDVVMDSFWARTGYYLHSEMFQTASKKRRTLLPYFYHAGNVTFFFQRTALKPLRTSRGNTATSLQFKGSEEKLNL